MNKLIFQIEDQITEMRLSGLVPKTISMCPVVLKALSDYLRPRTRENYDTAAPITRIFGVDIVMASSSSVGVDGFSILGEKQ